MRRGRCLPAHAQKIDVDDPVWRYHQARDFPSLEREALGLPADKRARLARDLLASLESSSDQELEELWRSEASTRAKELRSGEVEGIPAEDVYREAEALFR